MEPRSMYHPFIEATERYFNRLLPILVPLQVLIYDLWLSVLWSPYTLHTLPSNAFGMHVCKISNYFIILEIIIVNDMHILAFLLYPYYLRSEKGGGRGKERLFNRGTCLILWLREWALIQGRAVIRVWALIQRNLYGFYFFMNYTLFIFTVLA